MSWCKTCGAFLFTGGKHTCPPLWLVWCYEYDQSPHEVQPTRGHDAEDAAEKWAEEEDRESAEYSIVGGQEVTVSVVSKVEYDAGCEALDDAADDLGRDELPPGLSVKRFVVSGEPEPTYRARELSDEEGGARCSS